MIGQMSRDQLNTLALVLAIGSVVLSIMFKGLFLVLLVPAMLFWDKSKSGDK